MAVANDTTEVQAAVTAAVGKELFFPPGTYLVDSPITDPDCGRDDADRHQGRVDHQGALVEVAHGGTAEDDHSGVRLPVRSRT